MHERLKMFKDDGKALDDFFENLSHDEWFLMFDLIREEKIKIKNDSNL